MAATKAHDTALLKDLAAEYNLSYIAFDEFTSQEGAPSQGTLRLTDAFGLALEPAPVTPTGIDAAPYQLLSGTIKATYNAHRSLQGNNNIAVSPGMPTGNTGSFWVRRLMGWSADIGIDTRYYWKLSPHIFRYNHNHSGNGTKPLGGIHTVNECEFPLLSTSRCAVQILLVIEVDSYLEMIRFFTTLILNADESRSV